MDKFNLPSGKSGDTVDVAPIFVNLFDGADEEIHQ